LRGKKEGEEIDFGGKKNNIVTGGWRLIEVMNKNTWSFFYMELAKTCRFALDFC
jgi:hypothetical protein